MTWGEARTREEPLTIEVSELLVDYVQSFAFRFNCKGNKVWQTICRDGGEAEAEEEDDGEDEL